MNTILYFYRITYNENNYIFQSRGFETIQNLKISLAFIFKYSYNHTGYDVFSISTETNNIELIAKGDKQEIRNRIYRT